MNEFEAAGSPRRRPYRGLDPFGFAERDLFFGRDAESRVVSAMITTEPLSILTGASGTGKSSLIRAAVIPNLLTRGWAVVYAHPGFDAVAELQTELLSQAVLDMDRECEFIARLIEASQHDDGSGRRALDEDSRVSQACAWFVQLEPDDARRGVVGSGLGDKIQRIPWLAQVVAACVPAAPLVAAVRELTGLREFGGTSFDPSLRELLDTHAAAVHGRKSLIDTLTSDEPSLAELAGRIWREWLQPVGFCGLVMLIDQAEEIYTGAAASRLGAGLQPERSARLLELQSSEERLFTPEPLDELFAALRAQPMRLCFGLRPEWYTQLRVSLASHAPDESTAVHILSAMTREQAERAICKPVERVHATVNGAAVALALDALDHGSAGKGIDPFLLGLATNQAWRLAVRKRDLAGPDASGAVSPAAPAVTIEVAEFETIAAGPTYANLLTSALPESEPQSAGERALWAESHLVKGALEWLVHETLEHFSFTERFDALDMLGDLFTTGGTRRIVPLTDLVRRPLRPEDRLRGLLTRMEEARLVRLIRRGDEQFVEIRHDRLLEPLAWFRDRMAELERNDRAARTRYRSMLGSAIEMLLHLDGKRISQLLAERLRTDVLPGWVRESIRHNANSLAWDPPAARAALCSLLHGGPLEEESGVVGEAPDAAAARRTFRNLLHQLIGEAGPAPQGPHGLAAPEALRPALLRGLQVAPAAGDEPDTPAIARLGLDARMLLLNAMLRDGGTARRMNRDDIRKWTRACLNLTA